MALGALQLAVAEMVSDGADLDDVEDAISHARVGDEEKSALWLLAWSSRDPDRSMVPVADSGAGDGD